MSNPFIAPLPWRKPKETLRKCSNCGSTKHVNGIKTCKWCKWCHSEGHNSKVCDRICKGCRTSERILNAKGYCEDCDFSVEFESKCRKCNYPIFYASQIWCQACILKEEPKVEKTKQKKKVRFAV